MPRNGLGHGRLAGRLPLVLPVSEFFVIPGSGGKNVPHDGHTRKKRSTSLLIRRGISWPIVHRILRLRNNKHLHVMGSFSHPANYETDTTTNGKASQFHLYWAAHLYVADAYSAWNCVAVLTINAHVLDHFSLDCLHQEDIPKAFRSFMRQPEMGGKPSLLRVIGNEELSFRMEKNHFLILPRVHVV
ncbi:hypothetical protein TSMEX_007611 [Taenia solium]|eukprot:TsM_001090800 transcript=TsM_001090800 gene=TsM_001090800